MKRLLVSILWAIPFIFLSGCLVKNNQLPPEGPCLIQTLLISDTVLPIGIFYESGSRSEYDPPAKIGIEKIGTSFSSEDAGGIIHNIYRFNTDKEAQDEIEQIIRYEFENTINTEWFFPPIAPSITADKFELACMQFPQNGARCRLVAKYRVYVSDLFVDLIVLNYDDLKSIIEHLDNSMVACMKP